MVYILSCFNLRVKIEIEDFRNSLLLFEDHLKKKNLLEGTSGISKRHRHPIMDTDKSDFKYFFIMKFKNLSQMEKSVKYIFDETEPGLSLHQNVWKKIETYNFNCWEEL
ncbi:MAG: hypothetical protein VYA14_00385 [Pseudomonadota bacterium]|jgi:hypothetical protein|nr:hypothetical protein [Pseudomonadota bacterium]